MQIGILEQMEIRGYFLIDEKIARVNREIIHLRESFYNQSMSSHITSNGLEVISMGFSLERNVIPFVDTVRYKEQTIERLTKKRKYLGQYLNSLSPGDRQKLVSRYKQEHLPKEINQADIEVYKEILEIEDAINFIYGFPEINRAEISESNEDIQSNVDKIANMLGV